MSRVGMLDPRQNADADPKTSNKISKAPESMIKSYYKLSIFFPWVTVATFNDRERLHCSIV